MIGIYARLSVKNSGQSEAESVIENQIADCKSYMNETGELQKSVIYCDDGFSGRNFNRPAVQQLVCDIEAGIIDTVVVKDLSRLGRNVVEVGYYLEQYFPSKKVRFIAINDRIDTAKQEIATHTNLQVVLKNMVNELYAVQTSQKIKSVKAEQVKKGQFIGSIAPYGYEKAKDNPHQLEIDRAVYENVCMIFEWFAEGMSVYAICKTLNERKVATPTQYRKMKNPNNQNRVSVSWQQKTVKQLLSSKVYLGHIAQQQKTPYYIVENTHEAIVSEAVFAKVEARLQAIAERNPHISWRDNAKKVELLKGKIRCGVCNKKFRLQKSGRYHCGTNRECMGVYCTNRTTLKEEMIYAMLEQWLLLYQPQLLLQEKEETLQLLQKEIDDIYMLVQSEEKKRKQQFEVYAKQEMSKETYLQFKMKSDTILQESESQVEQLLDRQRNLLSKHEGERPTKETLATYIKCVECKAKYQMILHIQLKNKKIEKKT